eukprot:scaffold410590_cov36-Prasinocladus_malaysianus.AAC.1
MYYSESIPSSASILNGCSIGLTEVGMSGYTPLMTAAEAGHPEVVSVLCSQPACDLNLQNTYGQSALSLAAQNNREAAVAELLKYRIQNGMDRDRCVKDANDITINGMNEVKMNEPTSKRTDSQTIERISD